MKQEQNLQVVRLLFLVTLVCLVILSVAYRSLPNGSFSIFQLQFAFTESHFNKIVQDWGPEGKTLFLKTILWDYFLPLSLSLGLSGLLIQKKKKWGPFIALMAGLFDFIENTLHIFLFQERVSSVSLVVFLASLAACLKWIGYGTCGVMLYRYPKK